MLDFTEQQKKTDFDDSGTMIATYDYAPFGAVAQGGTNLDNAFRFSSEYADSELGLVYYNYRHYNPTDGCFINRDPIAEQGGYNLYAMVANNPANAWDVRGNNKKQEIINDNLKEMHQEKSIKQDHFTAIITEEYQQVGDIYVRKDSPKCVTQEDVGKIQELLYHIEFNSFASRKTAKQRDSYKEASGFLASIIDNLTMRHRPILPVKILVDQAFKLEKKKEQAEGLRMEILFLWRVCICSHKNNKIQWSEIKTTPFYVYLTGDQEPNVHIQDNIKPHPIDGSNKSNKDFITNMSNIHKNIRMKFNQFITEEKK